MFEFESFVESINRNCVVEVRISDNVLEDEDWGIDELVIEDGVVVSQVRIKNGVYSSTGMVGWTCEQLYEWSQFENMFSHPEEFHEIRKREKKYGYTMFVESLKVKNMDVCFLEGTVSSINLFVSIPHTKCKYVMLVVGKNTTVVGNASKLFVGSIVSCQGIVYGVTMHKPCRNKRMRETTNINVDRLVIR